MVLEEQMFDKGPGRHKDSAFNELRADRGAKFDFDAIFDRVFIINLSSRKDRLLEMEWQLNMVGVPLEDSTIEIFDAIQPKYAGEFPSIGARGCFLSHLAILEKAVEQNLNSILILEDDTSWSRSALYDVTDLARILNSVEWDLLHGGDGSDASSKSAMRLQLQRPSNELQMAHFVGFRGGAIQIAHRYLSDLLTRPAGAPNGGPMHVDGAYCWLRKHHRELDTYKCVPSIAKQRPSLSDISPPTGLKGNMLISRGLAVIRRIRKFFDWHRSKQYRGS